VSKTFRDGTNALREVDLAFEDGEFAVLVGPSGCGKTTALRVIAGLEQASSGDVMVGDRRVNGLPPAERDIAMVFQNYALYPHMSVYQNMAFGLRSRRMPRAEVDRRVREIGAVLGLADLYARKPRHLSGGQRQRVAMGRAIVRQPQAYLMDEPLSNLDAQLRVQMRAEIVRIQHELKTTTVYVTHDQVEAMTMGDRVAILSGGHLQQFDTPDGIYGRPANTFVAGFIGTPPMNIIQGEIVDGDPLACRVGKSVLTLPATHALREALGGRRGAQIAIGIRPEAFRLRPAQADARHMIAAKVWATEVLGAEVLVHAETEAALLTGAANGATPTNRIVGRFDRRWHIEAGDDVALEVDPKALHFFDPETGVALCHAVEEERQSLAAPAPAS
jgi:multiple sugar transport system ATP-binding protein